MDNASFRFERWLPASAAILLFSGLICLAGDPIIFSNEKSKPDPSKELQKEQNREMSKPWAPGNRLDPDAISASRPSMRGPRKLTKEEKQRRNEQEEKRNWLLLRPGQLQEEEERKSKQGFRDYDLQKQEDENAPRDYTFYGLGNRKNSDKSPQGRAESKSRSTSDQPGDDSDQDGNGREHSSKDPLANQASVHTANELDLKGLLNPSQKSSSARSSEKTEFTLKDLLNSTAPVRSREQTERMDAWRRDVLNAPDASASTHSLGDAKAQPEFGRSAANSTFAKPLDSPAKSAPGGYGGNTIFAPSSGFGMGTPAGSRGIANPGLPDTRSMSTPANFSTPSYPGYNPAYRPQDSPSGLQRVQPTMLEVPRRKF